MRLTKPQLDDYVRLKEARWQMQGRLEMALSLLSIGEVEEAEKSIVKALDELVRLDEDYE